MVEGTAVAGAGIFVLSVQGAIPQPLSVALQNWRLTVNDVLRQALLVACYVVLVIAGAKLLPFFAAQLVAALLALLATPLLVGRRHRVRPRWTQSQIRALAARTLPLAVSTVLIAMYFRVLVILMSLLEPSANQVGLLRHLGAHHRDLPQPADDPDRCHPPGRQRLSSRRRRACAT